MNRKVWVLSLFFGLLVYISMGSAAAAKDVDAADARILIDISGSMRKNDPSNLRRPALRLLVGLMPEDARAGVWTFGRYVNMLIPLGQVDAAWKKRARAAAAKISSPGQFTNIEEVIRRAIKDWDSASQKYHRHLILLTDGMVDISKNAAKNKASRDRILSQLLPKLKKHDARVHTIALSERADHELLKALSEETDGWYEQVGDADQLQRIFLRIFEKVGQPDTVPLKDNRFKVDSSIQEVTLLVFRKEGSAPTTLISPSGKKFNAKSAPKSVIWHRDIGFDMITIAKPESGEWKVQASMDPDNRVLIVTDLKMKSSVLPSRFVLGEQIPLTVKFTNQGKTITRKDFLDVVSLRGEELDSSGPGEPQPIYDDGNSGDKKAGDGQFTLLVGNRATGGEVELILRAEGQTFERESRQRFELAEPVKSEITNDDSSGAKVKYIADGEVVDLESLSYEGKLVSSQGVEQPVMILPGTDAGVQELSINPGDLVGDWKLQTVIKGKTSAGNDLALNMPEVDIQGTSAAPPPKEKEPETGTKPDTNLESEEKPESGLSPKSKDDPELDEKDNLVIQAAIFAGANLLLLLIGGIIYWLIRRKKGGGSVVLIDEDEAGAEAAK